MNSDIDQNNIVNSISRSKLRVKDLKFFNLDFKSEYNKVIISFDRYIYYYNIFIQINYLKNLAKNYSDNKIRVLII